MISKLLGKDEEFIARERPKVWLKKTAMEILQGSGGKKSDEIKVKLSNVFFQNLYLLTSK